MSARPRFGGPPTFPIWQPAVGAQSRPPPDAPPPAPHARPLLHRERRDTLARRARADRVGQGDAGADAGGAGWMGSEQVLAL